MALATPLKKFKKKLNQFFHLLVKTDIINKCKMTNEDFNQSNT